MLLRANPSRLPAAALCLCVTALRAQTHKVEKPQEVTRAVAVYEYTGELTAPAASRIVPVTLFINGHVEDADVYQARPVPFTLNNSTVYSIETAGKPVATFTIDDARNLAAGNGVSAIADPNVTAVWYGYGKLLALKDAPPPKSLKPSATLAQVQSSVALPNDDDAKPSFVPQRPQDPAPISHTPQRDPNAPSTAKPIDDDDREKPTLGHRSADAPAPAVTDDAGKKKRKQPKGDSGVIAAGPAMEDDPDRPVLRRGTPEGMDSNPPLRGLPADMHQSAAISDASVRDPQSFAYSFESSAARDETLRGMELLAMPRVQNYVLQNKLLPGAKTDTVPTPTDDKDVPPAIRRNTVNTTVRPQPAKQATKSVRTAKPQPAPPTPVLSHEHLSAYQLTYGGLPTFTYTAEVAVERGGPVYITLVAQRLPAGELQIAFSSVTDATHLDRTPWARPIDVVDPDAGHRGHLLMELRAQRSRQFALYRIITAQAEQTFLSGVLQ